MTAPTSGPCNSWIDPALVLECCPGLDDPPNMTILNRAVMFATNILFRASGRQYPGICSRTYRPCRGIGGSGCGCGCAGGSDAGWGYAGWASGWNNWAWDLALGGWTSQYPYAAGWLCGCAGGCNGCVLPEVVLPAPIASLTQVVINGEVQDLAEFAVQDYRTIVRKTLNSNGCLMGFPCTNMLTRNSAPYGADPNDGSRDHTWQLTTEYGRGPGEDGEWVTALYACQLAKLWCGASGCRLPFRVQTLARENTTIEFVDPSLFLRNGMTGLGEVDTWIRSVNPNGNMRRPSVQRLGAPSRNLRSFT